MQEAFGRVVLRAQVLLNDIKLCAAGICCNLQPGGLGRGSLRAQVLLNKMNLSAAEMAGEFNQGRLAE